MGSHPITEISGKPFSFVANRQVFYTQFPLIPDETQDGTFNYAFPFSVSEYMSENQSNFHVLVTQIAYEEQLFRHEVKQLCIARSLYELVRRGVEAQRVLSTPQWESLQFKDEVAEIPLLHNLAQYLWSRKKAQVGRDLTLFELLIVLPFNVQEITRQVLLLIEDRVLSFRQQLAPLDIRHPLAHPFSTFDVSKKGLEELMAKHAISEQIRSDSRILVFLSYNTKDKAIAGRLKRALVDEGINAFLAHDDIEVSDEWQSVILQNLDECDAIVPILEKSFRESPWTDQEVGIAIGKGKLVMSVFGEATPHGFASAKQGVQLSRQNVAETAHKIAVKIKKKLGIIN